MFKWNRCIVTKQMTNGKLGVVMLNRTVVRMSSVGSFTFVQGAWYSKISTNTSASYFKGVWSFVWGAKSAKAPCGGGTVRQNFSLLFDAIDSEKYLGYKCDMSSLQGMSSFLFISMTGPKVAQCIQLVSTLLHEAKPVLGLFCLNLNTIGA